MELKKVLMSRKSCRTYTDKPVEAEKLEAVVTSGSLAPLGVPKMGKPHLTIVTNKEMLKTLGYQAGPERDAIYGVPALIIVSCPESYPGIAEMNAACVVEMMSLVATDLGLGNIYLYGVCAQLQKNEALQKEIGIPENMKPLSALGLGYSEEPVAECKAFEKVLEENYIA
jgi:nitroreductase